MSPRPTLFPFHRAIAIVVFVGLTLFVGGCGGSNDARELTVTGIVTGVESSSLVDLASITVEDQNGNKWRFVAGGFVGMTPSHLRVHEATREKVTVTNIQGENDTMVIKLIADAPK